MTNTNECLFLLAKEFSKYPGGRLREHGPRSGEEFREDFLLPLVEKHEHCTIDLSGAVGYSPSFLDESFGELGKIYGVEELQKRLTIVADDDPALLDIVWGKIQKGAKEVQR